MYLFIYSKYISELYIKEVTFFFHLPRTEFYSLGKNIVVVENVNSKVHIYRGAYESNCPRLIFLSSLLGSIQNSRRKWDKSTVHSDGEGIHFYAPSYLQN